MLYAWVGIILRWGTHLHARNILFMFIVSLSGEVWVHKTSLIPPVSSQETELTCIHVCVKGVDFASFYDFDI